VIASGRSRHSQQYKFLEKYFFFGKCFLHLAFLSAFINNYVTKTLISPQIIDDRRYLEEYLCQKIDFLISRSFSVKLKEAIN